MRKLFSGMMLSTGVLVASAAVLVAQDYTLDAMHTGVSFQVAHAGISMTHGRFNDVSGTFSIDADNPGKSSFNVTIKTESVDTGNEQRDKHLRAPDFFNAKQFPTITFKSKSVKPTAEGLSVAGDLTLHGETKPVTLNLKGGKSVEFPKGTKRIGYSTDLTLKRSEFGMDKALEAVGDDVKIAISFEGIQK